MRLTISFASLLMTSAVFAAEPKVHRDRAYAEPKDKRQTLDVYAPAEGKTHETINSELGMPDDKPTRALFEFLDGVLKK